MNTNGTGIIKGIFNSIVELVKERNRTQEQENADNNSIFETPTEDTNKTNKKEDETILGILNKTIEENNQKNEFDTNKILKDLEELQAELKEKEKWANQPLIKDSATTVAEGESCIKNAGIITLMSDPPKYKCTELEGTFTSKEEIYEALEAKYISKNPDFAVAKERAKVLDKEKEEWINEQLKLWDEEHNYTPKEKNDSTITTLEYRYNPLKKEREEYIQYLNEQYSLNNPEYQMLEEAREEAQANEHRIKLP